MSRAPSLTSWLTGDPVAIEAPARGGRELLALAGVEAEGEPRLIPLAPGAALLATPPPARGRPELRWIRLAAPAALAPGAAPVEIAIALSAPFAEAGPALRAVSRLRALLRDPELRERARAATSREALVRELSRAEHDAGECPLPPGDALELLGSSRAGLSAAEAARRLEVCGPNRLERTRRRPLWLRFLEQFWSLFALLLWVGGALALLAGMPQLGIAIFVVILVNGAFSFLQEYRAERALEALERLLPRTLTVRRDGREARTAVTDLVPGDVVLLEEGDQVPADGEVLSSEVMRLDQGSLTGEPHPVFKLPGADGPPTRAAIEERGEKVFAGTAVVSGSGECVVAATGMRTEIGAIAHLTQAVEDEASPLQREMARVTRVVSVLAIAIGVVFFALGVGLRLLPPREGFLFALGVIVANVPEGLLPTLTLALALGVQRMARHGSIIRRLSAVETLGAVNVICTDKTGTLTENRMTVRSVWRRGREFALPPPPGADDPGVAGLLEAAALASVATAEHGDPTERALVEAAAAAGCDVGARRAARPVVAPIPFDSFRKRMTLVRAEPADGGAPRHTAWVKGAPRELLGRCSRLDGPDGARALEPADREAFLAVHERLAREGLRLLAVASRDVDPALARSDPDAAERDLTLLGLVALWDPPRPEVPEAVALCRRAGIHVAIVTGDYGLTARAIAARVGLPVAKIVTGEEVERLAPDALRELALEPGVLFARTSPAHKLAVVTALRRGGRVVAVTGDGVNDAPALKAADIGVAMGRRGSEVAREAAEMVIVDDNFASIVRAVRVGRAIYANIGRFVSYVLASNVAELVPFLAFVFLRVPLPLTVMQVLAVDLGTDLLPALALGAERPEPGVMDRPPRPRSERLLGGRRLLHAYGFLGVAEAALAMGAWLWSWWLAGWRPGLPMEPGSDAALRATTMTFAGIVAAQVGCVFACRTARESVFRVGLFSNRLVLLGVAAEIVLLLALLYVPPLARAFGLRPLSAPEWYLLLAFPPLMLLLEEARKWLTRRSAR